MNIYQISHGKIDEEIMNILLEDKNIRIEKIVSQGQTTDWYDQDENEFVSLLEGTSILEFEKYHVLLQKGDNIVIPAHMKHRVCYTSSNPKCLWLCVFY